MRTAIKVVAGGLVGFLGNLIPNALPDKTITVSDLIWATVTGLIVCMVVLGVTHERVWPKWAFALQTPIRRKRAPSQGRAADIAGGDERGVSVRTGPPVTVPVGPPVTPSDRHFVSDSVTPHYLIGLLEDKTDAHAAVVAQQYVGAWMRVTGTVNNVLEGGGVRVALKPTDPPNWKPTGTVLGVNVYASFNAEWRDRVRRLPKGVTLTVIGSIARVTPGLGGSVTLEHCEIEPKPRAGPELSIRSAPRGYEHTERTTKQAAEHRHFLEADITTHRLLQQAGGMTSIQLGAFVAERIGNWMRAEGNVIDVWEREDRVGVSLTAPGFPDSDQMGRVIVHFDSEWRDRAIHLQKGATVEVLARIADIRPNVSLIDLEHAEIVAPLAP